MKGKKVSLQVNGRRMFFSKEELSDIVEKHFNSMEAESVELAKVPTEEKWFRVYPKAINQELFQTKREDNSQEEARQLILEAFEKVKSNPQKYGKTFETTMPQKTWVGKSIAQFKELAAEYGGYMADWVEQCLEWAQRINNGETWEDVCNNVDKSNWYRVIVWKNTCARMVGGAEGLGAHIPATFIDPHDCYSFTELVYSVPLIVRYN